MIRFAKVETAAVKPQAADKGLAKGLAAHARAKRKAKRAKGKAAAK